MDSKKIPYHVFPLLLQATAFPVDLPDVQRRDSALSPSALAARLAAASSATTSASSATTSKASAAFRASAIPNVVVRREERAARPVSGGASPLEAAGKLNLPSGRGGEAATRRGSEAGGKREAARGPGGEQVVDRPVEDVGPLHAELQECEELSDVLDIVRDEAQALGPSSSVMALSRYIACWLSQQGLGTQVGAFRRKPWSGVWGYFVGLHCQLGCITARQSFNWGVSIARGCVAPIYRSAQSKIVQ